MQTGETPPPAVILAGGLATRLGGGDKVALRLGDRPILAHLLARLGPQVGKIALNANGPPQRFAEYGLTVLPDTCPGHPGPLAGILAALDWAAISGTGHVLTVAGDTPFVPLDLAARLGKLAGAAPVLAATDRPHPTCALWPTALRHDLRRALGAGQHKVLRFATDHGAQMVLFDRAPIDPFFNINTPDDLDRARCLI